MEERETRIEQQKFIDELNKKWLAPSPGYDFGDGSNNPMVNFIPNVNAIVVGNSPTLLDTDLGNKIDNYDKIIRCNFCETKGYEKTHGSRTSIWSTALTDEDLSKFSGPDEIEDKIIWFRTKSDFNSYVKSSTSEFHKVKYPNWINEYSYECLSNQDSGFKWLKDDIKNIIESNIQTQFPHDVSECVITTGLATILKAIRHFGKIDIVGFTFYCENYDTNKLINYYGPIEKENQKKHALYNYIIINHLVEAGKLVYINPKEKQILDNFIGKKHIKNEVK
tara:strand:+ start:147 stop:983 length:837 start_codon:yes stop_codon:yes gene_type:complete